VYAQINGYFLLLSPGTYVTQVKATASNPQAPGSITYSLDGIDKDWFNINSATGVITVAKTLDAEVSRLDILYINNNIQTADLEGRPLPQGSFRYLRCPLKTM